MTAVAAAYSKSLNDVDWNSVNHLHGTAFEIPHLLEAVRSGDPAGRKSAYEELEYLLVGDGMASSAGVEAAPYLIEIVGDDAAPDRSAACSLLVSIAVGNEEAWLTNRTSISSLRAEVERISTMSVDDLLREKAKWVTGAATQEEREARAQRAKFAPVEAERDEKAWRVRSYDAVSAGVPTVVSALQSGHAILRMNVAYLLSWFPERAELIAPALSEMLIRERNSEAAAVACVAAGMAGGSDPSLSKLLESRRRSPDRRERWASAMGLAGISERFDRAALVDLYDCRFTRTRDVQNWPFLGGSMSATAAVIAIGLDRSWMQERVDLIKERLALTNDSDQLFTMYRALLEAVFPEGHIPTGRPFHQLAAAQREAMIAVLVNNGLQIDAMINRMFRRYNLPSDPRSFAEWLTS